MIYPSSVFPNRRLTAFTPSDRNLNFQPTLDAIDEQVTSEQPLNIEASSLGCSQTTKTVKDFAPRVGILNFSHELKGWELLLFSCYQESVPEFPVQPIISSKATVVAKTQPESKSASEKSFISVL